MRRNFTLKTVAKEASTTKEDASRHEPQTIAIDVASRKELLWLLNVAALITE